jgi:hypothetical protein
MTEFGFKREMPTTPKAGVPAKAPPVFSAFWPLVVILLTLDFMTARDSYMLHRRTVGLIRDNEQAEGPLKKMAEQNQFVDSFKSDLETLAPGDPAAARILRDFFPPPPTPPPAPYVPPKLVPQPYVPPKLVPLPYTPPKLPPPSATPPPPPTYSNPGTTP